MVGSMHSNGTQVRRVDPAEWATFRQVRLAALADTPEAFASTLSRELAFDEAEWRRRAQAWPCFLAWCDGEPVGLAGVLIAGTGDESGWHLVSMWVSPQARGSGAADLLVSAVADHVRAAGAPRVTLWVAAGNDRARAFYLRCGFQPTGVWQTYQRDDGPEFDEEELALDLHRSDS